MIIKNKKIIYTICFVFVGLIVSGIAYYLNVSNLDNRNEAMEADSQTFNRNILLVGYNPVENGESAAEHFYSHALGGKNSEEFEQSIANGVINAFKRLSDGTINYKIAKQIQIDEFPVYPNGFQYDFNSYSKCVDGSDAAGCESRKWQFDNVKWVKDNNLCQIAEANNVDEIWVVSLQYVMTYEAFMIGPTTSFGINGPTYAVSGCSKQYPVVNPVYDRSENFLHDFGHRFEATMAYLTSTWAASEKQKYWEDFADMSCYGAEGCDSKPTCGNTHFAHNSDSAYDVDNTKSQLSNCVDWKNIPNFTGETQNLNCNAWGCDDAPWQEFWFSYIPRQQGYTEIRLSNGSTINLLNNWWYYLLSPENTVSCVKDGICSSSSPPDLESTTTTFTTTTINSTTTTVISDLSPADINNDNKVNMSDYSLFTYSYKSSRRQSGVNSSADIDGNGTVNMDDYELFTAEYIRVNR